MIFSEQSKTFFCQPHDMRFDHGKLLKLSNISSFLRNVGFAVPKAKEKSTTTLINRGVVLFFFLRDILKY